MGRLISILITLIVLLTCFICVKQPSVHKHTVFADKHQTLSSENISEKNIGFSNTEKSTQKSSNPRKTPPKKIIKQIIRYKDEAPQTKPVYNSPAPKSSKKQIQETDRTVKPQNSETNIKTDPEPVPKTLTEQEEIIAWNRWRSNLQNQVMKDSQLRAPLGTVFKFSFTVDKYGNMSNIKVWSTNPSYTGLAVSVIKPVLSSYQHKSILNFPLGTKRVITNVVGGFIISTKTIYSSPSDYSDYETVKK